MFMLLQNILDNQEALYKTNLCSPTSINNTNTYFAKNTPNFLHEFSFTTYNWRIERNQFANIYARSLLIGTNQNYINQYVNQAYLYGNVGQIDSILLKEQFTLADLETALLPYKHSKINFLIMPLIDCSYNEFFRIETLQVLPNFNHYTQLNIDEKTLVAFRKLLNDVFNLRQPYNYYLNSSVTYGYMQFPNPKFQIISTPFNQLGSLFIEQLPVSPVTISGKQVINVDTFISMSIGYGILSQIQQADLLQTTLLQYFITGAIQSLFPEISIIGIQQLLWESSFYTAKFENPVITFKNLIKLASNLQGQTFPNPFSDFISIMGVSNFSNFEIKDTQVQVLTGQQFASQKLYLIFRCFNCNDSLNPTMDEFFTSSASQDELKLLENYHIYINYVSSGKSDTFYVGKVLGENGVFKSIYTTMGNFNFLTPEYIKIIVCKQPKLSEVEKGNYLEIPRSQFKIAVYNLGTIKRVDVKIFQDSIITMYQVFYFEVSCTVTANYSINVWCVHYYDSIFQHIGVREFKQFEKSMKYLQNPGVPGTCRIVVCPTSYNKDGILYQIPVSMIDQSSLQSGLCGISNPFNVHPTIEIQVFQLSLVITIIALFLYLLILYYVIARNIQ